jgi:soluble lytic murein transglycosylase
MPASVSGDSRFAEMEEYTSLGLRAEAVACALSLSRDLGHDAIGQYSLALWLREHELYRPSIQAAANIIYTTGWSRSVPAFIWRLVYPSYYDDLVVGEAFSNGLDPLLFFALLRQESLYDPLIGSSAGAQGLAQVMPATGEWIAGQLGEAYVVSDLLRPNVAVRYGAWYLAQQLAYLDGDPLAGLAAYNAGPGNAVKWRDAGGGDPDFFYEAIAFSETRRYLDTILPNYYFYAWLYAGRG